MYWPSKAALNRHMLNHKEDEKTAMIEMKESDIEGQEINKESSDKAELMLVFQNIFDILKSQFEVAELF